MALIAHTHALARRQAAALATAALVAAVSAGCGGGGGGGGGGTGGGGGSAGSFIRQVTTEFSLGQSGRLWDSLHPADQAIVSRARYTACQSNSGFDVKKFSVIETYADTVDLAGKAAPSTAVSVRVITDDGVTTATMHAVAVNGKWRWILPGADYAAYKQGKCPPSS
jgi:hypothetical protein